MHYTEWMKLLEAKIVSKNNVMCSPDADNIHEHIKQAFLIPLTVLIIFFNVIILLCLVLDRKFHTRMYSLIATLGIADLMVGIVSIGTIITKASESTLDKCLVRIGFTLATCMASMLLLMVIAIERYLAITYSLSYRTIVTRSRIGATVTLLWVISLVTGFLPSMGWKVDSYGHYCSFLYVLPQNYILFTFSIGAVVPIIVMCIIYTKLFRSARFHIKRIEAVENMHIRRVSSSSMFRVSARSLKSLKTVVMVSGCIVLTWCPFLVATVVQISYGEEMCFLKDIIGTHLLLLGFSNSFLNPLIYVIKTRDFQDTIKEKLKRQKASWTVCRSLNKYQK